MRAERFDKHANELLQCGFRRWAGAYCLVRVGPDHEILQCTHVSPARERPRVGDLHALAVGAVGVTFQRLINIAPLLLKGSAAAA